MAYLALAYPDIDQSDYDWIQSFRKMHDSKYFSVVEPHFTLVFSTTKLSLDEFTRHVKEKALGIRPFNISLDSTKVVEDDSKEFFHVFLIPSHGFDEINKIHDELYTDELESELRHDISFIPHVGIGTCNAQQEAEEIVGKVMKANRPIGGTVSKLTIVEFDGKKVVDLQTIYLGD